VQAKPDDLVLLFFGSHLAPPTALPGFQGLFALDPNAMVFLPGAPVDMHGVSLTPIHHSWQGQWLTLIVQAGVCSPRDAASDNLLPPHRVSWR
jgi:hypothetical protein